MTLKTPELTRSSNASPRIKACSRFAGRLPDLLASVGFAALILVSAPASAQVLGTASNFAVLGATPNVTNAGATLVNGSVGVWPAASITGFPPGGIVPGSGFFHLGDAVAQQAQSDTTAAYGTLAGLGAAAILPALGGQTLNPGVYTTGAADLTGVLTINGPGLHVIQAGALTTASGSGASIVSLTGGATACDLWWQIGSSAAIGTGSAMQGNILALTSITIATGATLQGRALARNGTVTLDTNAVTACAGGTAAGFVVPALAPVLGSGVAAAPTLSEWAMIMLTGLLAIGGFVALRRKQRQSTRLL